MCMLLPYERRYVGSAHVCELTCNLYKVARITDEARERERRLENEEANAGKKRNKKAKKREAEELENR